MSSDYTTVQVTKKQGGDWSDNDTDHILTLEDGEGLRFQTSEGLTFVVSVEGDDLMVNVEEGDIYDVFLAATNEAQVSFMNPDNDEEDYDEDRFYHD